VDVENCCNSCHDALAVTCHSHNRSGNIVVCQLCHVQLAGGSNLELHVEVHRVLCPRIHSFQTFDPGDIDFEDPMEAMEYEHQINHRFPNFTIANCRAGHNECTYEVSDQTKSLPGLL
jgi:hypothetical protein